MKMRARLYKLLISTFSNFLYDFDPSFQGTIKIIMGEIGGDKSSIWIGINRVQPERVLFAWLDGRLFSEQDRSVG